ncbi:MAG: hypothetical protein JWN13_1830 [Betaproteobacteria bacterium]|nr:hypothetical protein [Betaproteobacteria bacterium]
MDNAWAGMSSGSDDRYVGLIQTDIRVCSNHAWFTQ